METGIGIQIPPQPTQKRVLTEPQLSDLLDKIKDETMSDLNSIAIGTIFHFYPDKQTADVQINYRKVIKGGAPEPNSTNGDVDIAVPYPVLSNCPVVVIGGGGGCITFPVAIGDTCLVLFCDRDIDTWFNYGITGAVPNSNRTHDLTDAIVLVGIHSLISSIAYYATNKVEIRYDLVKISLSATDIGVYGATTPFTAAPLFNVYGAIGFMSMVIPPILPTPGCVYFNSALNNWYGWKIVAYDPITHLPIYGWVALT